MSIAFPLRACLPLAAWFAAAAAEPAPASALLPPPEAVPAVLAPPVEDGPWIRPAAGRDALPVWGLRDGIRVGLWPTPGPRGLIRIYTPYLGQDPGTIMNFIAVEPVVGGQRGYSEMERSAWDAGQGRLMWSADGAGPALPWRPAAGAIAVVDGVRTLVLDLHVEAFANGARTLVRITLREDRPHEIALAVTAEAGGAAMSTCILTATMGNYARLRTLHLRQGALHVREAFPTPPADGAFTEHAYYGPEQLARRDGMLLFIATPDEADPVHATYEPGGWRYQGRVATQWWGIRAAPDVRGVINARTTYWQLPSHIPGGMAIENLELEAGFAPGREFRFGVTPATPAELLRQQAP